MQEPKANPRIAAIDVGTNSFHMVIAQVNDQGMLDVLSRDKEMVRLGQSGGDMKYIQPEAMKRAIKTLRAFSELAKSENALIRAVATSAVREAQNKEEFIEKVKDRTGVEIEVVSGIEEGRLINIGMLHSLPVFDKKTLLIDIGGGSTELVLSERGQDLYLSSAKLGAIRLTKKYFDNQNPVAQNIEKCCEYIKGEWAVVLEKARSIGFDVAVGTSGTITTLVLMAYMKKKGVVPDMTNGITVSKEDLLKAISEIKAAGTPEKIALLPGMDETRTDIILAGSLIIEYAVKFLDIKKITLSSFALREGIVFDTNQKLTSLSAYPHLSDLRFRSIEGICRKYNVDMVHSEHVKDICIGMFEDLKPLHGLGIPESELLEAVAYLHDIGFHISHDSHHKHSCYIIKNSSMPGFTNDELEVIANIARYHRKGHPSKKHVNFSHLSERKKYIIWVLGGILRIAEGIDRRQNQSVGKVDCTFDEHTITITLRPSGNGIKPDIELWGANRRREMLELCLDRQIEFRLLKK